MKHERKGRMLQPLTTLDQVKWHASHFRVTAKRVEEAVRQISQELSLGSELPHSNSTGAPPKMIA